MPSSAARRSPRAAPPRSDAVPAERPLAVPFAAAFGLLVAAEDLFLGWQLWSPDPGLNRYLVVPVVLAAAAVAGALLVFRGARRGWAVLAGSAVLPLIGILVLIFLLGAFGAWRDVWLAVLLLAGPVGCLVLTLRRPVRQWCARTPAGRTPGGRRGARASR